MFNKDARPPLVQIHSTLLKKLRCFITEIAPHGYCPKLSHQIKKITLYQTFDEWIKSKYSINYASIFGEW